MTRRTTSIGAVLLALLSTASGAAWAQPAPQKQDPQPQVKPAAAQPREEPGLKPAPQQPQKQDKQPQLQKGSEKQKSQPTQKMRKVRKKKLVNGQWIWVEEWEPVEEGKN